MPSPSEERAMLNDLLVAEIRKAVLDGKGADIRALLLNSDQVELVEYSFLNDF